MLVGVKCVCCVLSHDGRSGNLDAVTDAAPTSEDVFALLDHVLDGARPRLRRDAKPIAFEMTNGERWAFDPRAEGPLFARSSQEPAPEVLRVRCAPELLARLVTDAAFELRDDDDAFFDGDVDDLLLLVNAFEESGTALGIRTRKPS